MADTYAVVDVSKKRKNHPGHDKESAEFTVGEYISPLYDAVEADLESRSVPVDNEFEGLNAEYSMLARDGMYPRALAAGAAATTAHGTNQIAGKHNRVSTSEDVSCKRFICILVIITLVTLVALTCLAVLFAEIAKLKSHASQQTSSSQQIQNESVFMLLQQQLTTLNNQIQQLRDTDNMLKEQLHSNTMLQQQHVYPVTSCSALPPSSPSGYYWVSNSNGSPTLVYCTMSCGGVTGGWTRVGFLDMTNSNYQCPSGFKEHIDLPSIRTCVRNEASDGCTSVELSTANIQYSTVCGRITAYQVGTTNGFEGNNINSAYVDGVSLTHGRPRQHIWTFASGNSFCDSCHVDRGPTESVGSDFFCDSGNHQSTNAIHTFYGDNPLWDGVRCTADNRCCSSDNPYFLKTLPQPTTDDIEMRVCRDRDRDDEDIAIAKVEIYVQ